MALTKCKACGNEISTSADACPKCGHKQVQTSGCAKVGLGFIVVIAALVAIGKCSETSTGPNASALSAPATSVASEVTDRGSSPAAPQTIAASIPGSQWIYSHDADPMSKGTTHTALVISTNQVEFDFPYQGPQNGTLILRKAPRSGLNVFFKIERGQVLCNSYDDCSVLVRFDDAEAKNYSGTGSSDNSSETVFIENEVRFVAALRKAKRVRISVNIYQQGAPVFDFHVSGFDQSKFVPETGASDRRASKARPASSPVPDAGSEAGS